MIHSDSTCFWYNNEIIALVYCILFYYYFVQVRYCAELNHEMNCIEHQQQKSSKVSFEFSCLFNSLYNYLDNNVMFFLLDIKSSKKTTKMS